MPFAVGLTVCVALHALVAAEAWSPPPSLDRRDLFHDAAAAAAAGMFGTSAVVGGAGAMTVGNAEAATTGADLAPSRGGGTMGRIYEPAPNSLAGKVMVVTGGSTGLGLESAKRLAAGGATVVLTARTPEKGERALSQVRDYLSDKSIRNSEVYALTLNLDDLDSVRSFPRRYGQLLGSRKIDVLMNNAGVLAIPTRELTKDGFERTFQSNHLGPFVLTAELFPYLNRDGSRVINVSSNAHRFATIAGSVERGLDLDNLNGEVDYKDWPSYGRSKLENILFTQELQRRADAADLGWLTTASLHPGVVGTDIWRYTYVRPDVSKRDSLQAFASNLFYSNVRTVEEGANTQVWLASTGEDMNMQMKGQFFDEDRRRKKLDKFASDGEKARLLWVKSEELSGIKFNLQ